MIHPTVLITCDVPGCTRSFSLPETRNLRQWSVAAGWRHDGDGQDFCPEHADVEVRRA
jgi:hypothetical protein